MLVQGFGLAVGAILMDLKKATTVASITVMTFMLAGGFFVAVSTFLHICREPTHSILTYISILTYTYISVLTYTYTSLTCRKYQISYYGFGISLSTITPTNFY